MSRIRICVKRDEESSVGRGCILHASHFRLEMLPTIMPAAVATSPSSIDLLWLTEGWRKIRDTADSHEQDRAIDLVGSKENGERNLFDSDYKVWANRLQARLGDRYYVLAHDAGSGWHLHVQFNGGP